MRAPPIFLFIFLLGLGSARTGIWEFGLSGLYSVKQPGRSRKHRQVATRHDSCCCWVEDKFGDEKGDDGLETEEGPDGVLCREGRSNQESTGVNPACQPWQCKM